MGTVTPRFFFQNVRLLSTEGGRGGEVGILTTNTHTVSHTRVHTYQTYDSTLGARSRPFRFPFTSLFVKIRVVSYSSERYLLKGIHVT